MARCFVKQLETCRNAGGFEQLLLVVRGEKRQRRGDKVDQAAGFLDISGDGAQLVRERGRFRDDLLELADHIAHQRLDDGGVFRLDVFDSLDLGDHEGLGLDVAEQPNALDALGKDKAALVGHPHNLVHGG